METKLDAKKMELVRVKCGFPNGIDVSTCGSKGGLSLGWKGNNLISLRSFSTSRIDVDIQDPKLGESWRLTGFYVVSRNKRNQILRLSNDDGEWISNPDDMLRVVKEHLGKLFTASDVVGDYRVLSLVEQNVSSSMNDDLLKPFTKEDIRIAIKEIAPLKAPGLDGFSTLFFQKYWHIVGDEISKYCLDVLDENGKITPKLDLSKAYDRVEWDFIAGMMSRLRFHQDWIILIMRCVCLVSYAVGMNENMSEVFTPSRGLRQGDPLSPYLFLICAEGLSTLLNEAKVNGKLRGAPIGRNKVVITHLLFVDDCIIFGDASVAGVNIVRNILMEYELASGQ
ncbi:hypothetical protein J1N35_019813 [Gossypium stocksii]|uniref:Reverse transcriptase domain-containing protein n=1 Tax=Gossypium stocksii TaxID=47602 RepID=A0A9D3VCU9_9ROSI|nr:hypothetical protein J1N35_019813 [Gossypium stocksii]